MSIFDSLFSKLTPTDKAALTAALGWLASIDREYKEKNPDAETQQFAFDDPERWKPDRKETEKR